MLNGLNEIALIWYGGSIMCNTDYDPATVYNEDIRKARKIHRCSECYRIITIGENYKRVEGLWGNKWYTFKTCQHCLVYQDWLVKECRTFLHGGLQEEIFEHADDHRTIFLWRGVAAMRRKWKKRNSE